MPLTCKTSAPKLAVAGGRGGVSGALAAVDSE